ncbi:MAG: S9 family peptidase [Acidobacteriota bacterium]|nr:S9 family peptidase [Acidobacteriota bacterium]
MSRFCLLLACFLVLPLSAAEKRALTFEDFFTMKRISNPSLSPDGSAVLFRVRQADIESNKLNGAVYMADLKTGDIKLMADNAGSPVWRPDGGAIAYIHGGQIYINELDGSVSRQVTDVEAGASGPRFSPDGKWLLFVSTVSTKPPADHSGKLIENLLFRQWNSWVDGHRNHVFMIAADGSGEPRDLTPGDFDSPPLSLGSSHDYTFSPDGKKVAFVKNTDEMVAASTNNDIFEVDLATGKETRITTRRGGDTEPHYSPDGRYIAYVSMERPGFEADQKVIHLYDRKTGKHRPLKHQPDHSAGGLVWTPDSKTLYYVTRFQGARSIFKIGIDGGVERITKDLTDSNLSLAAGKLAFLRQSTTMPGEIFVMDLKTNELKQVTDLNGDKLAQFEMNDWEPFWFDSPNGAKVQGFLIRPPFFEEGRKYPMTFLIHGGPQGMWGNLWHFRWNAQMFAAEGNAVVMINPHGSKGYGQKFCDAVTRDWGGLPYQDLMKGLEVALERYPFIDGDRLSAAGASYGGYMINWIAAQEEHPFKAFVSHNGVFNMPSMAFATEELWFTEWEFGGTYMENPELYEKWSPHRLAKNFDTPMLVVHSEKDYRVPINQGIELFTAHRRQGIPTQWLYFPDEDHFVGKPHNARMWWRTVHGFINKHGNKSKKASGS